MNRMVNGMADGATMSYLAFMLSVLLTAVSSVMLKVSAMRTHLSHIREYLNPLVIGAYAMQSVAVFLTVYGYRHVPVSLGEVLDSTEQVFVISMSAIFLKERIGWRKLVGLGLIIGGVFMATFLPF